MKTKIVYILLVFASCFKAQCQVWQWSVKADNVISSETKNAPQAFLWIPENCKQVKGIVFGQHNMIEEGILENAYFRKVMSDIGFAEVWITPVVSWTYDTAKGEDKIIEGIFQSLADVSGYKELAFAPVVPIGHSAMASFPWNYAAFNPERTLSLISFHGDAPQSNLTGSGKPNPDWGSKNIDGIPALFIMGEYEWAEARIKPAYNYIAAHPQSVITLFADAGHGHFDYSEEMVHFAADYLKKAAQKRLPSKMNSPEISKLKKIKPQSGWLMDRWRKDSIPHYQTAVYDTYNGDRKTASWVFDHETAEAAEKFYALARGKKEQFIGFKQNGQIVRPIKSHANFQLEFKPMPDGISFHLNAFFSDESRLKEAVGFAKTALKIDRICGPVKKVNDSTFMIDFYRMGFDNAKRSNDVWLLAHNNGDAIYKSAVQQLDMRFPLFNKDGRSQIITFEPLPNVKSDVNQIFLKATSNQGAPISFYVKEGPAYIENGILHFTKIPPRTNFPVKTTVVAWQYGIAGELQSAVPVEQSFYIEK